MLNAEMELQSAKAVSKLDTLLELKRTLDTDVSFKQKIRERIDSNGAGSTLLRILDLVPNQPINFPLPLLDKFLQYYIRVDPVLDSFCFVVAGQNMNVTLEDILFLTNLPIKGKPLVPEKSRDPTTFHRVFSLSQTEKKLL